MKKTQIIFGTAIICCLLSACSKECSTLQSLAVCPQDFCKTESVESKSDEIDAIIPLDGDSTTVRNNLIRTRSFNSGPYLFEELDQLNQIPIHLQIKGNVSGKQFLNVNGEGKELTFEYYKSKDSAQQFYIRVLPAVSGIPYMIYSKKTNTPISLGAYSNNPEIKVIYAKPSDDTSTFGASWDIRHGEYSSESFIIENQDYPRQGSSGAWNDIYYSVITANDAKVSLEKYRKIPQQEFSIIPIEEFTVESVTFDIETATLSNTPNVIFSDKFINNGPINQNHTFTITDSYKETSSFNRKTSYNVNVATKITVKVPFVANGEINTSITAGQDFTYGESEEHTFSVSRTYPITVPPKFNAQMTLTLSNYNMEVEYCAVCVGKTSGRRINIRGTWRGVDVQESEAVLELTPINGTKTGSKKIRITDDMIVGSDGFIRIE